MNDTYDVIIVGGGVSGSSTAYFLAAHPEFQGSILVLERDPTYAQAPSALSSGGIRQQFSNPENVQMGLFGAQFVKSIDRYLSVDDETPDVGFKERGYLLLAPEDRLDLMRANNRIQVAHGASVEYQSNDALLERFPWLSVAGIAGGFLGTANEGWVDPYLLLQAYRRKARSLGVTFIADTGVEILSSGRRVTALTLGSGVTIAAGIVINCAGASGARALAAQVGVELPIESRKRCGYVVDCAAPIDASPMVILPAGIMCRRETNGFLINAAPPPGWPDPPTESFDVDYALFEEHIWPALAERIPAFEALKLRSGYCCHYDFNTLDENLIIGLTPAADNFFIVTGFSGHGLQQSPAVGRAVSELVVFGEYRTLDLRRFGFQRVLDQAPVIEINCY